MKKPLLAITFIAFPLSAKTTRLRNYGYIAIVLLAGCTSTQVRWDATRMRQEVMVYYNDQIMDNLIRAKNHVPFVHVDITLLNSQGSSQISGSIGYGETITNTGTNALTTQTTTTNVTGMSPTGPSSMHQVARVAGGLLETAGHIAMRPFTYSVTPQQTETLGITAAPALGSQAVAVEPPECAKPPQSVSLDEWESTKQTIVEGNTTTEQVPRKPQTVTIYEAYEQFAAKHVRCCHVHPKDGTFVLGTLRRWKDGNYYYVDDQYKYYDFCTRLFTKAQTSATSLQAQLQQIQGQAAFH